MDTVETSSKRGGRRPGAGRKTKSEEGHTVKIYLTFPPDVAEFLKTQKNASAFLTELVRQNMNKA